MKLYELRTKLDQALRIDLAYDWDNVGLSIGNMDSEITSITVSLELCDEVIDDAIANNSNLIILHHPLIFSELKNIIDDDYKQKMIIRLIKNDISLYVAHTNFDTVYGGLNDYIIGMFNADKILPLIGENEINTIGRIGVLNKPMKLSELVALIEEKLDVKNIRVVSKEDRFVEKIALVTGSGSEFLDIAMEKTDVFITGDLKYHTAQDAYQKGDCIIDANHYDMEKFFSNAIVEFLQKNLDLKIDFFISKKLDSPFKYLEELL